jgi:hypothetical protein
VDPARLVADLQEIGPRAACSDAERRAARLLARRLRELERRPRTETFWVRPQWPAVWLVHVLAGIAGSVASTAEPAVALGVLAATALSALVELGGRLPALSLLWPRRATQNIVSDGPGQAPVRLVVTAAYDAPRGRSGLAAPLSRLDGLLRRATGGWWPSPLAVVALALALLAGCAGARLGGIEETWLGAVQLVPSIVCITAAAVLAELALAEPAEDPNPAASAPAAVVALVDELDRRPARRLEVDVVLAGAGDARAAGMRAHVGAHRKDVRAEAIAVLHVEPCGAGTPRAWRREGPLLSVALHPTLVDCALAAGFEPHTGRALSGALAARRAGWPAVAVGRLDARDGVPGDLDEAALRDTVARCVDLVRRLDAQIAGRSF